MIEALFAIRRRILLIIVITVLGTGFSVYMALTGTRFYEAKTTLLLYEEDTSLMSMMKAQLMLGGGGGGNISEVVFSLLKSDTLTRRVLDGMKLRENEDYIKSIPGGALENEETTLSSFKNNLVVEMANPRIVVKYQTVSPELSAQIANGIASEVMDYFRELLGSNYTFMQEKLDQTKEETRVLEDRIRKFEEENEIVVIDVQLSESIKKMAEMNMRLLNLESEAVGLREIIESSSNPAIISMNQANLKAVNKEIAGIRKSLDELESGMKGMPLEKLKYFRMKRDLEIKQTGLLALEEQVAYLGMKVDQDQGKFQILDKAYPPYFPSSPKRKKMVIFSFIASLSLGIFAALGIALYRKQLDEYVRNNQPGGDSDS